MSRKSIDASLPDKNRTGDHLAFIERCKYLLIESLPFLATSVNALVFIPRPGYKTLGTDMYWRVYYDPRIIEWGELQVVGAIYHELRHLLHGHHHRTGKRNPGIFNKAGDCEINTDLRRDGFVLPEWVIYPEKYGLPDYKGAEWYYEELVKQDKAKPKSKRKPQAPKRSKPQKPQKQKKARPYKVGDEVIVKSTGRRARIKAVGPFDPDNPNAQTIETELIS